MIGSASPGARFASTAARKAALHTWLAWQKEPDRPYGVAIKARYFGATSAAADQFLAWFEQVFGVGPKRVNKDGVPPGESDNLRRG